jgi:hypothetical protein
MDGRVKRGSRNLGKRQSLETKMAENRHSPKEGEHSLKEGEGTQREERDGGAQREEERKHDGCRGCAHRARKGGLAQREIEQSPGEVSSEQTAQRHKKHAKRGGAS